MAQNVTIREVAAKAKVSIGTVSRVLNKHVNVSPDNVERVQQAIRALGYKPRTNGTFVSSRSGYAVRTGNICLFFSEHGPSWIDNPIVMDTFRGANRACRECGLHALLEMADPEGSELPRCFVENRVDGILIRASGQIPAFIREYAPEVPIVGLTTRPENLPIHQVQPNHRTGAYEATSYLWKCGHRRIAFLASQESHPAFLARLGGYEEFMRTVGAYNAEWVKLGLGFSPSGPLSSFPDVQALLESLWRLPEQVRPTAIVAANDWNAGGVYAAAEKLGISIPEDLSVVSFDNSEVCSELSPGLTSYDVPFERVSYVGTQFLHQMLEYPESRTEPCIRLVPGKLFERESVRRVF